MTRSISIAALLFSCVFWSGCSRTQEQKNAEEFQKTFGRKSPKDDVEAMANANLLSAVRIELAKLALEREQAKQAEKPAREAWDSAFGVTWDTYQNAYQLTQQKELAFRAAYRLAVFYRLKPYQEDQLLWAAQLADKAGALRVPTDSDDWLSLRQAVLSQPIPDRALAREVMFYFFPSEK